MKQYHTLSIVLLLNILLITACSSEPYIVTISPPAATATIVPISTVTPTPDPCAPENIQTEIEKIHKLMREFDDASLLASNTPLDQISPSIADLQRIRRETEDQRAPECLATLKQYQLAHMNTVINTLLGFLSGEEAEVLNQNIALARQQHDMYTMELASLLGLTVVAAPTQEVADGTPLVVATPTFAGLYITNAGPTTVNLRAQPDLNAETLGLLDVGASATVLGRTANALWYQIEFPGQPDQTAWVYVSLVQISDPTLDPPVVESTP